MKKDIKLCIIHLRKPKTKHTHVPGWANTSGWDFHENVVVGENINKRYIAESTFIINVSKGTLEKTRDQSVDHMAVVAHYVKQYKDMIVQYIYKNRQDIVSEMVLANIIEKSKSLKLEMDNKDETME